MPSAFPTGAKRPLRHHRTPITADMPHLGSHPRVGATSRRAAAGSIYSTVYPSCRTRNRHPPSSVHSRPSATPGSTDILSRLASRSPAANEHASHLRRAYPRWMISPLLGSGQSCLLVHTPQRENSCRRHSDLIRQALFVPFDPGILLSPTSTPAAPAYQSDRQLSMRIPEPVDRHTED